MTPSLLANLKERSPNIDFLLGYLKELLPRRPDSESDYYLLRPSTRTLRANFNNAPIIEVSGRTYPVEVRYLHRGRGRRH